MATRVMDTVNTITQLHQAIRFKDAVIREQEEELRECKIQLRAYKKRISELCQALRGMEKVIVQQREASLPLESSSTASYQKQPSTQDESSTEVQSTLHSVKEESISPAPCRMYEGSCTSYLDKAYFAPAETNEVYMYDINNREWSALPSCPHKHTALSVVNGLLTAVGGEVGPNVPTNMLISLREVFQTCDVDSSPSQSTWMEKFPSMPTRRIFPSAVCHKSSLIVAGGDTTWISGPLTTVEIMHTETLQWFSACHLPQPVKGASATVCEDTLYILGGMDVSEGSVLACSVSKLLSTSTKLPSLYYDPSIWLRVAKVPVSRSTCVNLSGQLVVVGGLGTRGRLSSTVYGYNQESDLWEAVGYTSIGRYRCLATSLLDGACVVVAGGLLKGGFATDVVTTLEVAAVESTGKSSVQTTGQTNEIVVCITNAK